MIDFTPVTLDAMAAYRDFHDASKTRAADYSFTNLWGWAEHYGLEWSFSGDLCWLRQTKPYVRYWAPMGRWSKADWAAFGDFMKGKEFFRVPEELVAIWKDQLSSAIVESEARDQWDYLYASEDLATLSGNRFHKKKNLLNQFLRRYPDHVYRPMSIECVEEVLKMQCEWCRWNECPGSEALMAENTAVFRVLSHWDQLPGLLGGAIWNEGKVVAYTVGEKLTDDTLVVHFEKGHTSLKGIYQAINCLFVRNEGDTFAYINREQDLGDEGLRKAKESYNPVAYVKKSTVTVS